MRKHDFTFRTVGILLLLTLAAVLIHGYHLGVEDQDVYLAAVKKNLNPALYPVNSIFFTAQMKASLFIQVVAGSIRWTRLGIPSALFLWHIGGIFLVLLGCWKVAAVCFRSERARWSGVLLVTVMLTLPISGTALYLVDQYLHPRALAAGAILLGLAACLDKRWIATLVWLSVAAVMHPLMALFGISLVVFTGIAPQPKMQRARPVSVVMLLPLGMLGHPSEAWKEATLARSYYFPLRWTWYEWLGLIGPLILLWWFRRIARTHDLKVTELLSTRLVMFGVFQFCVAAVMTMPTATQQMASLQPMRWLHIFYFVFLVLAGGLAGEFLLKAKVWRWLVVFVPLAGVMFYAQRDLFAHSSHIEWPGPATRNEWASAFLWVRDNTPVDAVFATDPDYMELRAEDAYGFRALAERSLLAEDQKDPGEATVFPELASSWQEQVHAQRGIETFTRRQFEQLHARYSVTWVVLPSSATVPLECPYRNGAAQVCRIG